MKSASLLRWVVIPVSISVLCQGCLLHQSNKDAGLRMVMALEKNQVIGVKTQWISIDLVGDESDFKEWCGPAIATELPLDPLPTRATSAVISASMRLAATRHETFVFVHGRPSSRFTFSGVLRHLTNAFVSCWLLDLPGHGFTRTMPAADQGLVAPQNAARQVLRFMRTNNIDGAVIVGHSYGGLVACYAAALAPNRVRGLVLIDSEGVARKRDEFLTTDKDTVEYSHCIAGTFGWAQEWPWFLTRGFWTKLFSPWRGQANDGIRALSSAQEPLNPVLLRERQMESAALVAIAENYESERWLTQRVLPSSANGYNVAAVQDEKVVRAVGHHFQTAGKKCVLVWGAADPLFAYRHHGVDVFAEAFGKLTNMPGHTFDAGHMPHEVYPERVAELIQTGFLQ